MSKYVSINFSDINVISSYEDTKHVIIPGDKRIRLKIINAKPVIGRFPTKHELICLEIDEEYFPESNNDGTYNLVASIFTDVEGDDTFISEEIDNDDSLKLAYELNELENYYLNKVFER